MKERDITEKILKALRTIPNSFWWKNHGGPFATRGLPDIVGVVLDSVEEQAGLHRLHTKGRMFAFEVKTDTGRLTPWQSKTLLAMSQAGAVAAVVRSVSEAASVLAKNGITIASGATAAAPSTGITSTKTKIRGFEKRGASKRGRDAQRGKRSTPSSEMPRSSPSSDERY